MNLEVYLKSGHIGKVTGIINSPILDVTDKVDYSILLDCERPTDLATSKLGSHGALACPWPLPRADKINKSDYERLTLRVRLPNNAFIYVTVGEVLKNRGRIASSNFRSELFRIRDLRNLPRFTSVPEETTMQVRELDDETISFLNSIAHVEVLNLGKDHERELCDEFKASHGFMVYHSWNQLAKDIGWLAIDFLTLEHRLKRYRKSLAGMALILEMYPHIRDIDATLFIQSLNGDIMAVAGTEPKKNGNSQGQVYHQMAHEQFVEERPDLECHSRDARNFYYETEPWERTTWLPHDRDSVFNQELPNDNVSQGHINSKISRDLRYKLILELFYDTLKQCTEMRRWEFSKHFYMEEGYADMGWSQPIGLIMDINNLSKPVTVTNREANIYTRWGKQLQRVADDDFNGPGIKVELADPSFDTHANIINRLHRQIFSTNRRWLNTRTGMLTRAERLHKNTDIHSRRHEAMIRAQADHMGVFLTQTQLHNVRVLVGWLYESFNIPQDQRRPIEEKFTVSESRLNDLAEEGRVLEGKLALIMHELTVTTNLYDLRKLQAVQQRLLRQLRGGIFQQKQMLKNMLINEPLSPAIRQRLKDLEEHDGELTMDSLELAIGKLELDTWQMCDPEYAFFDPNLGTSKLIFGKLGLSQRLEKIRERMEEAPNPNRATQLLHILRNIENRLDYCQRADTVFIDDLTIAI